MSFRNRRKSSGHGSSFLSTRRRSSASQKELEQLMQCFSPSGPVLVLFLTQVQLFFLWHLPAKEIVQLTADGLPLRHRATAFESCLLFCLLYLFGALLGIYPGQLVFLHWPAILASLCLVCLLLLILLFLGLRCPEEQRNHSMLSQLFYGRHLQPVLLNVDIKAFVTCRLALTLWALYLVSALFAHAEMHSQQQWPSLPLLTTIGLQAIYVLRRQWFEHLHTGLDNRNDRAGFYRLWAVLGPLPCIYVLPVTLGAQQDFEPERPAAFYAVVFLLGLAAQWLNTAIDLQRHNFRAKEGHMKLMGGKDPFYICAKFRRENGETGTGLLLGSGYWSLCRHPNYAAEFATFLCWCLPWTDPMAFLPLAFLAALLWCRMRCDELRCAAKYGQFWTQYCQRVPHRLVPGVY